MTPRADQLGDKARAYVAREIANCGGSRYPLLAIAARLLYWYVPEEWGPYVTEFRQKVAELGEGWSLPDGPEGDDWTPERILSADAAFCARHRKQGETDPDSKPDRDGRPLAYRIYLDRAGGLSINAIAKKYEIDRKTVREHLARVEEVLGSR